MWQLLLVAAPAWPASFSEDELSRMAKEVAPEVERAMGRTFLELPRLALEDRDALLDRIAKDYARKLREGGRMREDDVKAESRRIANEAVEGIWAYYSPSDERIAVLRQGFDDVFREDVVPEAMWSDVAKTVLAHELAHALQHQYAPDPPGMDAAAIEIYAALREGHAVLAELAVAEGLAGGRVEAFARAVIGLDVVPAIRDESWATTRYTYGTVFVEALLESGGPEAVWAALSRPPPEPALFWNVARPRGLGGWRVRTPVQWTRPTFRKKLWVGHTHEYSWFHLAQRLYPTIPDPFPVPPAVVGLGFDGIGRTKDSRLLLVVLGFERDGEAAAWIEARRASIRGGGTLATYSGDTRGLFVRTGRLPRLWLDADADATLFVKSGRYLELWAARGKLLAVGVSDDFTIKRTSIALAMVRALRWGVEEPGPDMTAHRRELVEKTVRSLASSPASPAAPSWQYVGARAEARAVLAGPTGCLEELARVPPPDAEPGRSEIGRLGHRCAVALGNVAAADQWLATLPDKGQAQPEALVDHARLAETSDWNRAVALLLAASRGEGDTARFAATRALELLLDHGEWERAFAAARSRTADPALRVRVAGMLADRGRGPEARIILDDACPGLNETSACDSLRQRVR